MGQAKRRKLAVAAFASMKAEMNLEAAANGDLIRKAIEEVALELPAGTHISTVILAEPPPPPIATTILKGLITMCASCGGEITVVEFAGGQEATGVCMDVYGRAKIGLHRACQEKICTEKSGQDIIERAFSGRAFGSVLGNGGILSPEDLLDVTENIIPVAKGL